jgi:hypothetical protein
MSKISLIFLSRRRSIYPDGGGHIILDYKKISRESPFSKSGSNMETNASPTKLKPVKIDWLFSFTVN